MKKYMLSLLLLSLVWTSDQIPASAQEKPILIKNATLHTVSHGTLGNYDLLFENGIITRIEDQIVSSPEMDVVDGKGKHVYPGLIATTSTIGLNEVSAVRASVDINEVGNFTPEVRANVSYNPDSEHIPVARSNGVLFANVVPIGGRIPGQSSLMMMDGWTWEDATYNHPTAMHINWPNMRVNTDPNAKKSIAEQEEDRRKQIWELDDILDRTRQYEKIMSNTTTVTPNDLPRDIGLEALLPYIHGEKPFFIHAYDARDIEAAVHWSINHKVRMVIIGGWDSWKLTSLLKEYDIPVIVDRTLRLPWRRYSSYDAAYTLPMKLYQAGVQFAISPGVMQSAHIRDLPNHAAMASAFGLPREEALRSITLSAAEILGVSDQIGSLDVGKDATLFIADGDILEIVSHVEQAYILGTKTDMSDRHKTLYKKYQEKYNQLGILGD